VIPATDPSRESQPAAPEIHDHVRKSWDVVVVGAGPAGCIAATHLATRGHRVLLLDRQVFPREKVCGDGLIPDALRALGRAGIENEVRRRGHGMRLSSVFSPSRIEVRIPGDFVTLKRREFDAALAERAQEVGAIFCVAEVAHLDAEPDGSVVCDVTGVDRPVRARAALVATGASVSLLRKHGQVRRPGPSAVALRAYVRSRFELDRMVISYDRSILPGYAWIFPLGRGEYNVGCGVFYRHGNRDGAGLGVMFDSFCREFPLMRDLMKAAESRTSLKGAPLRCGLQGVEPAGPGNTLAIGETIGATFPFSGEGIGKAMETAELAAETIHEALESDDFRPLNDFGARLQESLSSKYVGYELAEKAVSRAWLVDFMAHRAKRSRFLQEAMAGIIAETRDPGPLFTIRGLLRSYVS
jgi:geranylgeranyl reductase family protein